MPVQYQLPDLDYNPSIVVLLTMEMIKLSQLIWKSLLAFRKQSPTVRIVVCILVCFLSLLFTNCTHPKAEITADYISYEGWDRKGAEESSNNLYISRLRVKQDSLLDPFSGPGQSELLSKLEVDSSFICFAQINLPEGENYRNKRIYFDRDNGFPWIIGSHPTSSSVPAIGRLQAGQWYEIAGLSYKGISKYVYVDSARQVHKFNINQANW